MTPGSPTEGEQVRAGEKAKLSNPEAVAEREASRTSFENLGPEQAEKVAGEAFPALVNEPAGGPPKLPAGQSVVGYLADNVARVALPGGKHGVIESGEPMAVETSPGQRTSVALGLGEVGGAFEPKTPVVGVRIPKQLGSGVSLARTGVSLTPVSQQGSFLSGSEGALDGASVFYANTQTDTDTVVKPATVGFAVDTLLRSVNSPSQLSFRVGLPTGASLVAAKEGSGEVSVVDEGAVIAVIPAPTAHDADGVAVPVSMSVSGQTIVLSVDQGAGDYRYPIVVDPSVIDEGFYDELEHNNWAWQTDNSSAFKHWDYTIEDEFNSYTRGQYGQFVYTTQGESHIYKLTVFVNHYTRESTETEATISIASPGSGGEGEAVAARGWENNVDQEVNVCAKSCEETVNEANENNRAYIEVSATNEAGGTSWKYQFPGDRVYITQEHRPSAHYDTTDKTINGQPSATGGSWVSKTNAVLGIDAFDPGVGIDSVGVTSSSKSGWGTTPKELEQNECAGVYPAKFESGKHNTQCNECYEAECSATKAHGKVLTLPFSELGELPEGEDPVEATVEDAVGLTATAKGTVKVDNTPPHNIVLSNLPSGDEIGESEYSLKVEATSGLAGMQSIAVAVDGREIGKPAGSCSPGSCTGKGEWAINGNEFGVGEHKLQVTATDNAGNVTKEEVTLKVHHATPVSLGTGSVDPWSGEFTLGATDVSIASPGSSLTVARSYHSRHLTAGSEGPLGPQWSLSIGGQESITKFSNGYVTLIGANGGRTSFATGEGGKFTSPTGDKNLALSEVKNEHGELTEYLLTDAANGSKTHFTSTAGPSGSLWKPTKQEGPLASQTARYIYQTVEGVTEPKFAIAPEPAGLSFSCIARLEKAEKLEKGCRVLEFKYAEKTKENIGENKEEWGEYKNRLKQVLFEAYNTSSKKMEEPGVAVAEYAYDKQGRLRAEWNPQLEKPLKVTYGYDAEGHVTALTPSGQESWAFTYGAIASDPSTGRLLKATQAPTSAALWNGEPPQNTQVPTLSGSTVVGVTMGVANGTWSNSPVAYGYQWEDCNSEGKACIPILGATNANYKLATSDVGHTVVAQVWGTNGGGSVLVASVASAVVTSSGSKVEGTSYSPGPGSTIEYHVPVSGAGTDAPNLSKEEVEKWGQKDYPAEGMAIFPPDKPQGWPASTYERATLDYWDEKGRTVNTSLPTGGISTSEYNADNDVVRTLSPDSRAAALKETCESKEKCKSAEVSRLLDSESVYEETGSEPGTRLLETLGPQHTVKLAQGKEKAGEEVLARDHVKYSYDEGAPSEGGPYDLVTKTVDSAQTASKEEFDKRETTTSYSGQNGWKLRKPTSTTTNPNGLALTHTIAYEESTGNVKETNAPAAAGYQIGESSLPSGSGPLGITASPAGENALWFTDELTSKIGKITTSGAITEYSLPSGSKPWGITAGPAGENALWFTDELTSKIGKITTSGAITEYTLPSESRPKGITAGPAGENALWFTDRQTSKIGKITTSGTITEYSLPNESEPIRITAGPAKENALWFTERGTSKIGKITTSGTITEYSLPKDSGPEGIVAGPDGNLWFTDYISNKVGKITTSGAITEYALPSGSEPEGIAAGPEGEAALWFADYKSSKIGKITTSGTVTEYALPEKSKPFSIISGPEHSPWFVGDGTSKIGKISLDLSVGELGAHDTQTIYYSVAANEKYKACGEHPEWASLPCQTQPAEQPEVSGQPNLPVTKYEAYNVLDEPEKTTETVGSTERKKTETYDPAGRLKTSAISSTVGTTLPTVTDEYNSETGALEKQSTTSEGKTKTITSKYNTRGQLASYIDADEGTTAYEYDEDGRVKKVNDSKGTETYTYNTTTGLLAELLNEYGTTKLLFTATYDAEGNLLTEGYPNGMTATYTYNAVGKPVSLKYKKITHCTEEEKEKCIWFKDTVVPSIYGQWLEQTSTLSHQAYTYDTAGRLTQVQNTPTGGKCTTRIYAYEAETNRTSLTTYEPNSKGECATETGTQEKHSYDTANRLIDSGVKYNEFGDITALPAKDAGGKESSEELTSTYYTDNQLASQTQNGETIGYNLDPAGRTREIVSTGKKTSDVINHYTGPGDAPAWTENVSKETTRNIPGIGGQLAAVQNNTEAPVLQLANLHGDIIATAYLSETATELATKTDTSEYGVPTTNLPPKYSWLGALEFPTELPSGTIAMGARSYVPELGRFLQPDPVPSGSANAYTYTFGDPVNTNDPTGAYTATTDTFDEQHASEVATAAAAARAAEVRAAEEAAARAAAEQAALLAKFMASLTGPQYTEAEEEWGGEEEWYEEEEEGGYEEAAYHTLEREASFGPGVAVAVVDNGEGHIEDAVVESGEGQERNKSEPAPQGQCSGHREGPRMFDTSSGPGHREYVNGAQCPVMPRAWYRNHVYGSVKGGRITIRHGSHAIIGAIKITAGALGMAAGGFSFAACAVGGGEVDLAIHCILGPGAAFDAGLVLAGEGIKELF